MAIQLRYSGACVEAAIIVIWVPTDGICVARWFLPNAHGVARRPSCAALGDCVL